MTETDELKRMLDERGVKWWVSRYGEQIVFQVDGVKWFADDGCCDGMLELSTIAITPEQAIAATLGESNESVRTLIDDMLDFIGNCCNTTLDCACCDPVDCKYLDGDGELAECTRYQDFRNRARAIAATLGGGECEIVRKLDLLVCTACNRAVGKAENDCPDGGAAFFRFCPKCGKKAKR